MTKRTRHRGWGGDYCRDGLIRIPMIAQQ